VISFDLTFAITAEEAANPVMQTALSDGMADSIGVDHSTVSVSAINGVAVHGADVSLLRRKLSDASG
jgi:hypothetical protein